MKELTYKHTLFTCYFAYITQAIVVNYMPILFIAFQEEYNVSFSALGSLVLLNFITQLIMDILGARYIDSLGFRKTAVPAHILSVVGLALMGILPSVMSNPYIGLAISVIIFSAGGGLIEVVISPVVDAIHKDGNSASMNFLHSFYCWGQLLVVLITTLILKIFGHQSWKLLSFCWAIIPLINVYNFSRVPLPPTHSGKKGSISTLFKTKTFLLALLLMVGSGAGEQIMAQWSSMFAQKGLALSKATGDLLGPCLFAFFMASGRMFFGINEAKLNLRKSLLFCSGLCVICYLTAVFSGNALLSLAACAVTGFAVSIMWPGVLSYTSMCFPKEGAAMFAVMAIFGDVGCSVGPWLTGVVSDATQKLPHAISLASNIGLSLEQIGLRAGILAGVIFPISMIAGLIFLKTKN